jgi:hypothetical protein
VAFIIVRDVMLAFSATRTHAFAENNKSVQNAFSYRRHTVIWRDGFVGIQQIQQGRTPARTMTATRILYSRVVNGLFPSFNLECSTGTTRLVVASNLTGNEASKLLLLSLLSLLQSPVSRQESQSQHASSLVRCEMLLLLLLLFCWCCWFCQ